MTLEQIRSVYFLGAGGIGMSALVRYYLHKKKNVAGYDRTETFLTKQLNAEGADIHYEDSVKNIPEYCLNKDTTLVIVTPAVPEDHSERMFFRENGFTMIKRAQALGEISNESKSLCIAGTHGKTTTSSMTAHLFKQSPLDCNAFLGGILKNYGTNLLLSDKSEYTVVEADEYDRSFHRLKPYMAVITSVDPDHLDIYKTPEAYNESFRKFTSLIRPGGSLIVKKELNFIPRVQDDVKIYTYSSGSEGDFHTENIRIGNGEIIFDFVTPQNTIKDISLGVPVRINIENGVAAMALAWLNGISGDEIRKAMASFQGAERRFDFHLKTDKTVLIDDYAHHPDELKASITSVRELYPGRKISVIFQPHLYSRTRDFAGEFAESLSSADEVILTDIYPARELPIEGVTSQIIFDRLNVPEKYLLTKQEIIPFAEKHDFDVLLMAGAGDIENVVQPMKKLLIAKLKNQNINE
ncbi:MAG: UDP-N-acetylmuramate--L-alanine ligase [Candidatus Azobacteroides sp.]|nr:UDP-N-acetylmuramate--L-alanine ligase [Candidatus Azobacteroides sp.]